MTILNLLYNHNGHMAGWMHARRGERQEMGERIKVAGDVKLAKLWEKRREEAMRYHQRYYSDMFLDNGEFELMGVYVDITGSRQTAKCGEMVRLLKDCSNGKVQCIASQTRGYLAANTQEFCYLVKMLFDMGIHLITEDETYHIDTIRDTDGQKAALQKMVEQWNERIACGAGAKGWGKSYE